MAQQNTSHFKLSATSCGTCAVHFDTAETRRAHSKSQWHVTNLKRRIADLEPLTAEQHASEGPAPIGPTIAEIESDASSSSVSDDEAGDEPEHDFIPEECLFCNNTSENFDDNVEHMHKTHGMFIPQREKLIVDLETLVRYLHLVIYGYRECLQCATQRRSPAAVQQHMVGKNHCRFDIDAKDSEFRDFYEHDTENGDAAEEDEARKAITDAVEDGGSVTLPSGKTLSHRSAPAAPRPRTKVDADANGSAPDNLPERSEVDESRASFQLTAPSTSIKNIDTKSLTRAQKRDVVFETQLARLSINDQTSLAHLPMDEQRNALLTQKKQLEKAERSARRLQTRLEMKANRTAQGNFVNDVPGRKNG